MIRSDDVERGPSPGKPSASSSTSIASRGVTREDRWRVRQQRGLTVWLTGLSGAGKTTLAQAVEARLVHERGAATYLLDGDALRATLCAGLGFTAADRAENVRRAAEVARFFADSGAVVLASLISPAAAGRDAARALHAASGLHFVEVHVHAPLAAAEARDPKGLYRRARAGQLPHFTGVSAPYEPPESPDLLVDTSVASVDECAAQIYDHIAHLL